MLNAYLAATASLLQNPSAPTPLYSNANLTTWINSARGQLAGESECIRYIGTLALTNNTQVYPFSAISLTGSTGIQGVLNVRQQWVNSGTGQLWLRPDPWEWFSLYSFNSAAPTTGQPTTWAQYGQGATGSLYISPIPNGSYTAKLDCVCYPAALASDTDPEAIPYLWTDAVPYFAAYLALLSSQTGARTADADKMFQRYTEFVNRARRASTPSVLPWQYPQNATQGGLNAQAAAR